MCKHFVTLAILVLGADLTVLCAGCGLDRLLSIASHSSRTAPPQAGMKTVLIRVESVGVEEAAALLRRVKSEGGQLGVNRAEHLVRVTDTPRNVERMKRILREVDSPPISGDPYGAGPGEASDELLELPVGPPGG